MTTDDGDDQDRLDMGRLAQGHDAALNDLMTRHAEKLLHYLTRQIHSESLAAELTQETFVRVYQNRARFDPSARFSTWLYTIATNLLRNRFRWQARHPEISLDAERDATGASLAEMLPGDVPAPGARLESSERAEAVRRAVMELPADLRSTLILAEYEDLAHAEIATVEGCSVKAVESRLFRARQQLRSRLAKLIGTV
jgi:RNA polymerase sigma-70 factor (ECF subfamily)